MTLWFNFSCPLEKQRTIGGATHLTSHSKVVLCKLATNARLQKAKDCFVRHKAEPLVPLIADHSDPLTGGNLA